MIIHPGLSRMDNMKSYFLGDETHYEKDSKSHGSTGNNKCTFNNIPLSCIERSKHFGRYRR